MERRLALAGLAISGLILAGCGAHVSASTQASVDIGYVNGVAFPCSPMMATTANLHIQVVVLDHGVPRFTEPATWTAGVDHFRFALVPGHYTIYEEQRYSGPYERVSSSYPIEVMAYKTTNINVGGGCK